MKCYFRTRLWVDDLKLSCHWMSSNTPSTAQSMMCDYYLFIHYAWFDMKICCGGEVEMLSMCVFCQQSLTIQLKPSLWRSLRLYRLTYCVSFHILRVKTLRDEWKLVWSFIVSVINAMGTSRHLLWSKPIIQLQCLIFQVNIYIYIYIHPMPPPPHNTHTQVWTNGMEKRSTRHQTSNDKHDV